MYETDQTPMVGQRVSLAPFGIPRLGVVTHRTWSPALGPVLTIHDGAATSGTYIAFGDRLAEVVEATGPATGAGSLSTAA